MRKAVGNGARNVRISTGRVVIIPSLSGNCRLDRMYSQVCVHMMDKTARQ